MRKLLNLIVGIFIIFVTSLVTSMVAIASVSVTDRPVLTALNMPPPIGLVVSDISAVERNVEVVLKKPISIVSNNNTIIGAANEGSIGIASLEPEVIPIGDKSSTSYIHSSASILPAGATTTVAVNLSYLANNSPLITTAVYTSTRCVPMKTENGLVTSATQTSLNIYDIGASGIGNGDVQAGSSLLGNNPWDLEVVPVEIVSNRIC